MHVFTYGTLMYRPVWRRVTTGEYRSLAGALHGYSRMRVLGERYPALVRATPESTVRGIVYLDVSSADLAALDHFEAEGEAYLRIPVPVELEDGSRAEAWTYLALRPERVEDTPWEPERFEAEDLKYFLDTYCRDRAPR